MNLRGWVKKRERVSQGETINIRQRDGSVARFPQTALAQAFSTNMRRLRGEAVEPHPLTHAADNAADPWWRESFYASQFIIDADGTLHDPLGYPLEDRSEQA